VSWQASLHFCALWITGPQHHLVPVLEETLCEGLPNHTRSYYRDLHDLILLPNEFSKFADSVWPIWRGCEGVSGCATQPKHVGSGPTQKYAAKASPLMALDRGEDSQAGRDNVSDVQ